MSDVEGVAHEATADDVANADKAQVEQTEDGQPQGDGQTPEAEGEQPDDEGSKSESQKRRERRKAEIQRLRQSEAEARARAYRLVAAAKGEREPKRDDFDDPDEYIAAKAAWNGSQAVTRREQEAAQEELQRIEREQQHAVYGGWVEQVEEARSRYQDFDKVVFDQTAPISEGLASLLMTSDMGADIAYHLASNRAEAKRLSELPPVEAAREIGRLEARLTTPQPKSETAAPPPPRPVSGRGAPERDPAKMSMDEYRKWRLGK